MTITLEPDSEKREIKIPIPLQRALGTKLTQKLNALSFSHKKEFVAWYSDAKKEDTRARRVEKMKRMLSSGKGHQLIPSAAISAIHLIATIMRPGFTGCPPVD